MLTKPSTALPLPGQGLRSTRLGLAQISPRLGDVAANLDLHLETLEAARGRKTELLLFPELSLTGYQLRDLVPDVARNGGSSEFTRLVDASRDIGLGFGFVEESADHRFFNSYAYCQNGQVLHVHRKAYLPTYGLFEEGRLYAAGDHLRAFDTTLGRLGIVICEDLWHPSVLYVLTQDGAELIVAAAASPVRGAEVGEEHSNIDVWATALKMYSQLFSSYVVLVNRVGFEDGLSFWGGSRVLAPGGRSCFEAPLFEAGLFTCEIDWNEVRRARISDPTLRSERLELTLGELRRIERRRRRRLAGADGLDGWKESS